MNTCPPDVLERDYRELMDSLPPGLKLVKTWVPQSDTSPVFTREFLFQITEKPTEDFVKKYGTKLGDSIQFSLALKFGEYR